MLSSNMLPWLGGTNKAAGEEKRHDHTGRNIRNADGINPNGPPAIDTAPSEKRALHCSKLGTWNINGLNLGKLNIVKNKMNRLNI